MLSLNSWYKLSKFSLMNLKIRLPPRWWPKSNGSDLTIFVFLLTFLWFGTFLLKIITKRVLGRSWFPSVAWSRENWVNKLITVVFMKFVLWDGLNLRKYSWFLHTFLSLILIFILEGYLLELKLFRMVFYAVFTYHMVVCHCAFISMNACILLLATLRR